MGATSKIGGELNNTEMKPSEKICFSVRVKHLGEEERRKKKKKKKKEEEAFGRITSLSR